MFQGSVKTDMKILSQETTNQFERVFYDQQFIKQYRTWKSGYRDRAFDPDSSDHRFIHSAFFNDVKTDPAP